MNIHKIVGLLVATGGSFLLFSCSGGGGGGGASQGGETGQSGDVADSGSGSGSEFTLANKTMVWINDRNDNQRWEFVFLKPALLT